MSDSHKKLFLIDAMALIYRAHFAFSKNPRINSKGTNTGAILGFCNSLFEIIKKESPTHLGVAFDTHAPTFRHIAFKEYKAHREATPDDIKIATPIIKEILAALDIPVLELDGFEADDIIGTLAKAASNKDYTTYMMTPDKDYAQLVEDKILWYKPAYMGNGVDILGIDEVLAKFEIQKIDQIRDLLGLQGDSADNIPGIPGVGKKTAIKYIAAYGSVEGLIEHVEELKGKQKENVSNFAAQGILSKELATIKIDVPIALEEDKLLRTEADEKKLTALFEELEFKNLAARILGNSSTASPTKEPSSPEIKPPTKKKEKNPDQLSMFGAPAGEDEANNVFDPVEENSINTSKHDYQLIETAEQRAKLIKDALTQKEICFDSETTSLDAHNTEIIGLSFCWEKGEAYYVHLPEDQEATKTILEEFIPLFTNKIIRKIGQNLKFDMAALGCYDIKVEGPLFDTMLAHYLLEPDKRHNMDILASTYLNYSCVPIESLIGKKGAKQGSMRSVPLAELSPYACEDADITWQLKEILAKEIEDKGLTKLLGEIEAPLIPVLNQMEAEGITIDKESLDGLSKTLGTEALRLEEEIYKIAGVNFNIASPKQLGDVLFDKLKLVEKPKKTKTGQYATGEEILSGLQHEHPIAKYILEFREVQKLKSTYVDALPALMSPRDQRIHTSYNQAVAATGRLSSTNPNLQNIPIRTSKGKEIRKAFIPRDSNHILMAADYSQIELRIMASFAKDESMTNAFKNGIDIHTATAAKIFKTSLEDVDSDMRRKAKTANFGIIYGVSAFGLAQQLSIPRKEAASIIESYFNEFPLVKSYMDRIVNDAKEQEYVETYFGRRRYLRDINSQNATLRGYAERNAINAPIQGTAADIIKIAMINVAAWMQKEKLQSKMILQVHDELVFDVVQEELELMQQEIPKLMKDAIDLEIAMEVNTGIGENWLEAH